VYIWVTSGLSFLLLTLYVPKVVKEEYMRSVKEVWILTTDRRPTDDRPQGQFTHFGEFQMAITLQHVIRSPSYLVLGWGFWGRRIEQRHFWLDQIQDGGRRPFWKKNQMAISLRALSDSLYVWTQTILSLDTIMTVDAYGRRLDTYFARG